MDSLLDKVADLKAHYCALLKKTPVQVFSCKFCKIVKNTYVAEYLQKATSES